MEAFKNVSSFFDFNNPKLKAMGKEVNEGMVKAGIITLEHAIGSRIIDKGYDTLVDKLWFISAKYKMALKMGWVRSTALSAVSVIVGIVFVFVRNKLPVKYQLFGVLARDAAFLTAANHGKDAVGLTAFLDKIIPSDLQEQLGTLVQQLNDAGMLEQALEGKITPPAEDVEKN